MIALNLTVFDKDFVFVKFQMFGVNRYILCSV